MKEIILIALFLYGVVCIFCLTDIRFFFLKKTKREKRKIIRKILNSLSQEEWETKINNLNERIEFNLNRSEKGITTISEVIVRFTYKNESRQKGVKLDSIYFNINVVDSTGGNAFFKENTNDFFLLKEYSRFFKSTIYKKNDKETLSRYKRVNDGINLTFKSIKRDKRDKKINKILNSKYLSNKNNENAI